MNKLCECKCGLIVTPTIYRSKIRIARFIKGHNSRVKDHGKKCRSTREKTKILENINKLCKCGCGEELINKHNKFLNGHNSKGRTNKIESNLKNSISHVGKIFSEEHKRKISEHRKGHIVSLETKKKISESNTGKKRTKESRLKISNSLKGHVVSLESKLKMSISTIKRIEKQSFDGGLMYPRIGRNEISILNQIEKEIELKIDRNSRKLAGVTGKFNDGFLHKYNLGLDVLEEHHFKSNGELKDYDLKRQEIIAWKLGCMIYYIREQEFLKNPEKEIQRLKDFLVLLDQGKN